MVSQRIAFRAVPPLDDELAARADDGGPGTTAQTQLRRYFAFLAAQLATVHLTEGQAGFLCDLLNGTLIGHDAWLRRPGWMLAAEIEDAEPAMADKWGIDRDGLVELARKLSPGQGLAVLDAVERYWRYTGEADTLTERLTDVGLLRPTAAHLDR